MIQTLTRKQQIGLVKFYLTTHLDAHVISRFADSDDLNPNFVYARTKFHKNFILDGQRITPSTSLTPAPTSIVQMDLNNIRYVGQIFHVFIHKQAKAEESIRLLKATWFRRLKEANTTLGSIVCEMAPTICFTEY